MFFEGSAVLSMSDTNWSCKGTESISYLRVEDSSFKLLAFPARFARLQNLQVVYLSLGKVGKDGASVSLSDGLANVRRLCIIGDDLFVTVPANVQWEEVCFSGEKSLGITFVDATAFVSRCSRFAFCYKSLVGTWMPILCRCFAAQSLDFEVGDHSDGRSLLYRGSVDFVRCFCGACLTCLARSQKALRKWAT